MNSQNLLLIIYEVGYRNIKYEVHAEMGLVNTFFYLTYPDSYPRVFLTEMSNKEIADMKDQGYWEEFLKQELIDDLDVKKLAFVNNSYPDDDELYPID